MKTTRGGKRANAGRKPATDKKIQIGLYVEQSKIDKFGGVADIKVEIYKHISK